MYECIIFGGLFVLVGIAVICAIGYGTEDDESGDDNFYDE
jgi:hypothetical protein